MLLRDVKELLNQKGEIRLLTRENDEVRVTDLFLNGDGLLRLEQYSKINKEELLEHAVDGVITELSVDSLLGCVKLWTLFEEDEDTNLLSENEEINKVLKDIEDYLAENNLEELPKMSFYTPDIAFMDSDEEKLFYIGI